MSQFRIKRMQMAGISLGIFHKKNPWMAAWWSAALPGLGHLWMGEYFKGLILMTWESYVNLKANVNMAILYTFTGRFQAAQDVIDEGWALVYVSVFCFAIFDGYRMSVELNTLVDLERKQKKRQLKFTNYSIVGVNYLSHKNPWVAAGWSALFVGFGHIYNMKTVKGVILSLWLVTIIYLSHFPQAVIYTFTGRMEAIGNLLDYHWLMFFPSIYVFGIWDSYNDAVEMNKLFEEAFKQHLRRQFGDDSHLKR
ncbi:conserved hypothetical protein [Heliomicrobium modesticaldum Ice1]|uniref:Uncharacterized protein n=1 Tax=Heliobacterium modesticaldum (strain ATCC 51547 / Ice1) TaxID=498761 RepID=B0TF52_HELMI|nr:hypothetical protein [Heliomicrobium modesticaldum]ABZ83035.1 conserved hypothetical protein [Heliomicrobium modesticaldum Ice1]